MAGQLLNDADVGLFSDADVGIVPTPKRDVGFVEGAARGLGGSYAGLANLLAMAAGGAGVIVDKASSLATGRDITTMQDLAFENLVEPTRAAQAWWDVDPNTEQLTTGGEVGNVGGALTGMLQQGVAMGPAAVTTMVPTAGLRGAVNVAGYKAMDSMLRKAPQVVQRVAPDLARGAVVAQPIFAQPMALDRTMDLQQAGVDDATAMQAGAVNLAGNTAMGALPLSMTGNVVKRMTTGAASNVLTGAATRGAEGAVLGDEYAKQQQAAFGTKESGMDAGIGAIMAGLFGPRAAAVARAGREAGKSDQQIAWELEPIIRAEREQQPAGQIHQDWTSGINPSAKPGEPGSLSLAVQQLNERLFPDGGAEAPNLNLIPKDAPTPGPVRPDVTEMPKAPDWTLEGDGPNRVLGDGEIRHILTTFPGMNEQALLAMPREAQIALRDHAGPYQEARQAFGLADRRQGQADADLANRDQIGPDYQGGGAAAHGGRFDQGVRNVTLLGEREVTVMQSGLGKNGDQSIIAYQDAEGNWHQQAVQTRKLKNFDVPVNQRMAQDFVERSDTPPKGVGVETMQSEKMPRRSTDRISGDQVGGRVSPVNPNDAPPYSPLNREHVPRQESTAVVPVDRGPGATVDGEIHQPPATTSRDQGRMGGLLEEKPFIVDQQGRVDAGNTGGIRVVDDVRDGAVGRMDSEPIVGVGKIAADRMPKPDQKEVTAEIKKIEGQIGRLEKQLSGGKLKAVEAEKIAGQVRNLKQSLREKQALLTPPDQPPPGGGKVPPQKSPTVDAPAGATPAAGAAKLHEELIKRGRAMGLSDGELREMFKSAESFASKERNGEKRYDAISRTVEKKLNDHEALISSGKENPPERVAKLNELADRAEAVGDKQMAERLRNNAKYPPGEPVHGVGEDLAGIERMVVVMEKKARGEQMYPPVEREVLTDSNLSAKTLGYGDQTMIDAFRRAPARLRQLALDLVNKSRQKNGQEGRKDPIAVGIEDVAELMRYIDARDLGYKRFKQDRLDTRIKTTADLLGTTPDELRKMLDEGYTKKKDYDAADWEAEQLQTHQHYEEQNAIKEGQRGNAAKAPLDPMQHSHTMTAEESKNNWVEWFVKKHNMPADKAAELRAEAKKDGADWASHQDYLEAALEDGKTIPQRVIDDYRANDIKPDPKEWPLLAKLLGVEQKAEPPSRYAALKDSMRKLPTNGKEVAALIKNKVMEYAGIKFSLEKPGNTWRYTVEMPDGKVFSRYSRTDGSAREAAENALSSAHQWVFRTDDIDAYIEKTGALTRDQEAAAAKPADDIDPWIEGESPTAVPKAVADRLREMIGESGWAERGGRLLREHSEHGPDDGAVVGRTKWIPKHEWWGGKPKGLTEANVARIIERGLAGQIDAGAKKADRVAWEWLKETAEADVAARNALEAEGLPATEPNMKALDALDEFKSHYGEDALTDLSDRFPDDAKFHAEVERMNDEARRKQTTETTEGISQDVPRQEGQDAANEMAGEGNERPDFSLDTYSISDLAAREQQRADAERAEQQRQRDLERRQQAEGDRPRLDLSGSDRAADAAGQADMLGNSPRAVDVESTWSMLTRTASTKDAESILRKLSDGEFAAIRKRRDQSTASYQHVDDAISAERRTREVGRDDGFGPGTLSSNPFANPKLMAKAVRSAVEFMFGNKQAIADHWKKVMGDIKGIREKRVLPHDAGVIERSVRWMLDTAHGSMRAVANKYHSEVLHNVIDQFQVEAGNRERANGRTFDRAVGEVSNEYLTRIQAAIGEFDANPAVLNQVVAKVRSGNLAGDTKVDKAAREVAAVLTEIHSYMKEAGVDVGTVPKGYFPREFNGMAVLSDPLAFARAAEAEYRKMGHQSPAEAATALADTLMYGDADGMFKPNAGQVKTPFTESRVFGKNVDNQNHPLHRFLETDHVSTLTSYVQRAARRAEIARRFGDRFDHWSRGWTDKNGVQHESIMRQIENQGARDAIPELQNFISHAAGLRNPNVSANGVRAASVMRTWGSLMFLEGATLSSLTEFITPAIRAGGASANPLAVPATILRSFQRTVADLLAHATKSASALERRAFAEDLGLIASTLSDSIVASRFSGGEPASKLESRVLDNYYKRTGLTFWTDATRSASVDIGRIYIRRLMKQAKDGDRLSSEFLAEMGVPKNKQAAFIDAFAKMNDGMPGSVEIKAAGEAGELYRTAIGRFLEQSIMAPNRTIRPKWAASPFGGIVAQLQSYNYAFYENVWKRIGSLTYDAANMKNDYTMMERMRLLQPLATIPVLIGMAYLIGEARDEVLGDPNRRREETKEQKWLKAASRGAPVAPIDPILNFATSAKYQKSAASSVSGPVLGKAFEGAEAVRAMAVDNRENTNSAERKAAKAAYDLAIEPAVNLGLSLALPAGAGTAIATQTVGSKRVREAFVSEVAGKDKNAEKLAAKQKKNDWRAD
jgi:hypothetical protein